MMHKTYERVLGGGPPPEWVMTADFNEVFRHVARKMA